MATAERANLRVCWQFGLEAQNRFPWQKWPPFSRQDGRHRVSWDPKLKTGVRCILGLRDLWNVIRPSFKVDRRWEDRHGLPTAIWIWEEGAMGLGIPSIGFDDSVVGNRKGPAGQTSRKEPLSAHYITPL